MGAVVIADRVESTTFVLFILIFHVVHDEDDEELIVIYCNFLVQLGAVASTCEVEKVQHVKLQLLFLCLIENNSG